MKKLKTFLLLIFVLSFLGTIAQESSKLKIEELPSLSEVGDEVASLGYAGMVGGVHNDVLLLTVKILFLLKTSDFFTLSPSEEPSQAHNMPSFCSSRKKEEVSKRNTRASGDISKFF